MRQEFGVKGLASRAWLDGCISRRSFRRRSSQTACGVSLNRRARHGAIRTEHAAIARKGFQALAAFLAVIEESARVDGHRFHRLVSAPRTGQHRFRDHARFLIHRLLPKLAADASTVAQLLMDAHFLLRFPGTHAACRGFGLVSPCLQSTTQPHNRTQLPEVNAVLT